MTASATAPPHAGTRLGSLDGLRALALAGMLAWHAEIGWVKGGFARMTVFFVLSGFLATGSFVRLARRGKGSSCWVVGRVFWVRRARRLLPVTVIGLVASTAVTVAVGSPDMAADVRGDVLSVVGYVSNWRFLLAERSYGALFDQPSAFQHYWSLSLEEQCFLALPLLLGGAAGLARRRWAPVLAGVGAAALASTPLLLAHSPDAAYYGTHVRAGEFLAGVALALAFDRCGGSVPPRWRPVVSRVGVASLAVLTAVMLLLEREQAWLYRGGLGLFAVPAVALVAAATLTDGPVSRLLAWRPLVALGRAAFPVYVLHRPVYVLLDRADLGLRGTALISAKLCAGVGVGLVVHHWFERPLLEAAPTGRASDRRVLAGALVSMVVVVTAVTFWRAPAPAARDYDFAEAERRANGAAPAGADGRPAVALFGGSTAVSLGAASFDWAAGQGAVRIVAGNTQLGCGVVTEGRRGPAPGTGRSAEVRRPDAYCTGWESRWPEIADRNGVQLALMFGGVWETADWQLDGHSGWTDLTDPEFAELVRAKLVEATDALVGHGRHALLATSPPIGPGRSGRVRQERGLGDSYPERVDVYNRLVRDVAAANAAVDVLDYAGYVAGLDPATAVEWLPHGIHPTEVAARAIWDEFLGGEVLRVLTAPPAHEVASGPAAGAGAP